MNKKWFAAENLGQNNDPWLRVFNSPEPLVAEPLPESAPAHRLFPRPAVPRATPFSSRLSMVRSRRLHPHLPLLPLLAALAGCSTGQPSNQRPALAAVPTPDAKLADGRPSAQPFD